MTPLKTEIHFQIKNSEIPPHWLPPTKPTQPTLRAGNTVPVRSVTSPPPQLPKSPSATAASPPLFPAPGKIQLNESVLGPSVTEIFNGLPYQHSSAPLTQMRQETVNQTLWQRITAPRSVMDTSHSVQLPPPNPRTNVDSTGRLIQNPEFTFGVGRPNYNEFPGFTAARNVAGEITSSAVKTFKGVVENTDRTASAAVLNAVGVLPQPGQSGLKVIRDGYGQLKAAPVVSENIKFAAEQGQEIARLGHQIVTDHGGSIVRFGEYLQKQDAHMTELFAQGHAPEAIEMGLYTGLNAAGAGSLLGGVTYALSRGIVMGKSPQVAPQVSTSPAHTQNSQSTVVTTEVTPQLKTKDAAVTPDSEPLGGPFHSSFALASSSSDINPGAPLGDSYLFGKMVKFDDENGMHMPRDPSLPETITFESLINQDPKEAGYFPGVKIVEGSIPPIALANYSQILDAETSIGRRLLDGTGPDVPAGMETHLTSGTRTRVFGHPDDGRPGIYFQDQHIHLDGKNPSDGDRLALAKQHIKNQEVVKDVRMPIPIATVRNKEGQWISIEYGPWHDTGKAPTPLSWPELVDPGYGPPEVQLRVLPIKRLDGTYGKQGVVRISGLSDTVDPSRLNTYLKSTAAEHGLDALTIELDLGTSSRAADAITNHPANTQYSHALKYDFIKGNDVHSVRHYDTNGKALAPDPHTRLLTWEMKFADVASDAYGITSYLDSTQVIFGGNETILTSIPLASTFRLVPPEAQKRANELQENHFQNHSRLEDDPLYFAGLGSGDTLRVVQKPKEVAGQSSQTLDQSIISLLQQARQQGTTIKNLELVLPDALADVLPGMHLNRQSLSTNLLTNQLKHIEIVKNLIDAGLELQHVRPIPGVDNGNNLLATLRVPADIGSKSASDLSSKLQPEVTLAETTSLPKQKQFSDLLENDAPLANSFNYPDAIKPLRIQRVTAIEGKTNFEWLSAGVDNKTKSLKIIIDPKATADNFEASFNQVLFLVNRRNTKWYDFDKVEITIPRPSALYEDLVQAQGATQQEAFFNSASGRAFLEQEGDWKLTSVDQPSYQKDRVTVNLERSSPDSKPKLSTRKPEAPFNPATLVQEALQPSRVQPGDWTSLPPPEVQPGKVLETAQKFINNVFQSKGDALLFKWPNYGGTLAEGASFYDKTNDSLVMRVKPLAPRTPENELAKAIRTTTENGDGFYRMPSLKLYLTPDSPFYNQLRNAFPVGANAPTHLRLFEPNRERFDNTTLGNVFNKRDYTASIDWLYNGDLMIVELTPTPALRATLKGKALEDLTSTTPFEPYSRPLGNGITQRSVSSTFDEFSRTDLRTGRVTTISSRRGFDSQVGLQKNWAATDQQSLVNNREGRDLRLMVQTKLNGISHEAVLSRLQLASDVRDNIGGIWKADFSVMTKNLPPELVPYYNELLTHPDPKRVKEIDSEVSGLLFNTDLGKLMQEAGYNGVLLRASSLAEDRGRVMVHFTVNGKEVRIEQLMDLMRQRSLNGN